MGNSKLFRGLRDAARPGLYQTLAIVACVLLGLAMILNTQMGGEGMWFWYATAFRHGAKLYSGLHIALQPLFILETSIWMRLFGSRAWVYELPSVGHLLILCLGFYLVLREADWPDWQKGLVLAGVFCLFVCGHSYRFDDYHVIAEILILYSFFVLLRLAQVDVAARQRRLVCVLGLLCGLTITTRLTDGAALLAASAICLPFLLRRGRVTSLVLLFVGAVATVVVVVKLTGDTLSQWISSSILKAAGSKGGTGSIFAAPLLLFRNTLHLLHGSGKKLLIVLLGLVVLGFIVDRFWRRGARYLVLLQLAVAAVLYLVSPPDLREQLRLGTLISAFVLLMIVVTYLLAPIVATHFGLTRFGESGSKPGLGLWDSREVLVIVPLAEWASYSAGAGAEPLTNYYAPVGILLMLFVVMVPFRRIPGWVTSGFVTVMTLIAVSGFSSKVLLPYSWQNYVYGPMFVNREWYHHPVYGPLYIDSDLLHFSKAVCADIGDADSSRKPELLSLPYPFPNYFCATPPWHDYVQTFFDTSTRTVIDRMMEELNTAPPQYIVYQRQMQIMTGAERLYNHGQPIAQRNLDALILAKIATGQWRLIEKRDYLDGDGWYIIRTRP